MDMIKFAVVTFLVLAFIIAVKIAVAFSLPMLILGIVFSCIGALCGMFIMFLGEKISQIFKNHSAKYWNE